MKAVFAWWQERDEKERRWLQIGAALAALLILFSVFFEPAFSGRQRLLATLPALREQVSRMDTQAGEAHALQAQGSLEAPVGEALRSALAASMREHGFDPGGLTQAGSAVRVQLRNISFAEWTVWLDETRQQFHAKVSEAHVTAIKPGQVDLSATLTPP